MANATAMATATVTHAGLDRVLAALRAEVGGQAYLFDDPAAYLAGVDDLLGAIRPFLRSRDDVRDDLRDDLRDAGRDRDDGRSLSAVAV